jgi:hypothetical protein
MKTEDMTGVTVGVSVNAKIDNAAYYGTPAAFTLPTIELEYDGGTTESDVASESTDTQSLFAVINPTTSYGTIYVSLKQKTDATYANSKVTWDSLVINSRKYSKQFTSYPKTITQTDTETIYVFTTPATNTNITETDAATVAAYTGIAIDHGAQTITVTSDKTFAEIYDYTQYDLTLAANMVYDDWLTTVDGTNYTSDYEIIADGADLNALGKTITGTVTVSSGGFFEDSSGAKWEDSGTIYYAKHVYRNIKAVTGGANKQYAVIAAFDATACT